MKLKTPSKILAAHLTYRGRAEERGKIPQNPSYFLKAPSTLSADGGDVVRPQGCRLLAFEGEIALVMGSRAHRVSPAEAWSSVGWVTAANDFGVYDLRYADPGSNVHSKSFDGFTPIGPSLLDACDVDPTHLVLSTWLNGDRVQHADSDDLLFSLEHLVADLSRVMTLLPGDVILTGTPRGSSVAEPGDIVEVEVEAGSSLRTGRLRSHVAEGTSELQPWGAPPRITPETLAAAYGADRVPGDLD